VPYQEQGYISEVIVVDGHSTDGTREIIRQYPVRLLLEEGTERYDNSVIRAHLSKYNALNQGWRASTADLVMFLDSDAYLGQGFFPKAVEFFVTPSLGVLGCWNKAWVTTRVTSTIGELWRFHGERIRAFQANSASPLERFYQFAVGFGKRGIPTSGPCYIVRRSCLELLGGHDVQGDVGICLRLQERGFTSWWWIEAPVYHRPKESLRALARQRYNWGKDGAYRPVGGLRFYFILLARPIGAMGLGLLLAVRFRNPLHLIVLPLAEGSHLAGYVAGCWARARGKT
jgi:cellulose synthase/poly-beta-1,6-N-acetylglucosamine synthase-like glycosyltransferase